MNLDKNKIILIIINKNLNIILYINIANFFNNTNQYNKQYNLDYNITYKTF